MSKNLAINHSIANRSASVEDIYEYTFSVFNKICLIILDVNNNLSENFQSTFGSLLKLYTPTSIISFGDQHFYSFT